MAGKIQGDKSGNIYVEFDYNNIIIVDPNKTVDSQGNISERLVDHEDLVMYANLEAELLPRTKLALGSTTDNIRTISIAKINFLAPTKDDYLSTNYYDELTGKGTRQGKGTNQTQTELIPPSNGDKAYTKLTALTDGKEGTIDTGLLGITSIAVKTSSAFIPSVSIQLEDVQGRALFQLGENSPYAAFLHLPYPPFYLTMKGYYGQAIRYQLNLEKFNVSFNSTSGNYQVNLEFKGYKFNILNEIQMGHLIAAPHMYSSRFDISNSNTGSQVSNALQGSATQQSSNIPVANNSKNTVTQQMFVEKGYQKIIEVYGEYKSKKLIPQDFPELTLQQLINKLENFEKNIIDNYKKSDVEPLTNMREYIRVLKKMYGEVYSESGSWFTKNLNPKPFIEKGTGIRYYAYKESIDDTLKPELDSKLDSIIIKYNTTLNSNPTLGLKAPQEIKNPISINMITATTTADKIDWVETTREQTGIISPTVIQVQEVIQSYNKLFKPTTLSSFKNLLSSIGGETPFIARGESAKVLEFLKPHFFIFDGQNRFIDVVNNMNAEATKKLADIENKITKELKEKIEDSKTGIGFSPTVRNIVSIIMASAEGFIRLMDDVHTKAWGVRYDPIRKSAILNNTSSVQGSDTKDLVSGIDPNSQIPVYPWPQFFVETDEDKKGKYQLKYIGDPSIISQTKGYLYDKWPEVEFVEEYIKGITQRFTPPNAPTPENIKQFTNILNINAIEFPQTEIVYSNKEEVKFFYEIWERQFMTSRYSNLSRFSKNDSEYDEIIKLLVEVESKNILDGLGTSNPYLNSKLKNYKFTAANYTTLLSQISNNGTSQSYIDFIRDIFVTPYIKSYTSKTFGILSLDDLGKQPATSLDDNRLEIIVKSTQTNEPTLLDIYPFTNAEWGQTNLADGQSIQDLNNVFNTTKVLNVYKQRNVISNFTDINNFTQNRPVTNFSFLNVQNPLSNNDFFSSTNQTSFLPTFYSNRQPLNFIPTEGYCLFDVPKNKNKPIPNILAGDLPIQTTTSILNTPFFINSIVEGVAKSKNNNELPYVEAAYLFINSLPLISLREKYKSNSINSNQLDYMFASLKKFGAIHKLPYSWILKIGSLWYRYKLEKETGVDILSKIWRSADYKDLFDPITKKTDKIYTLDFNGNTGNTIQLEYISSENVVVQSGFYPKLINDFNYFYKGGDIYSNYSDSEIQQSINEGLKLYNFTESNLNVTQNDIPLRYITWSVLLPGASGYYFIPSFGGSQNQVVDSLITTTQTPPLLSTQSVLGGYSITGNTSVYNGSMRLLWAAPNYGYFDESQIIKPDAESYLNNIVGNSQSISPYKLSNKNDYTKIEEIFSVFNKEILDSFEFEFKNFSKSVDKLQYEPTQNPSIGQQTSNPNLTYRNFQSLMRTLMVIDKPIDGVTNETYFLDSIDDQLGNFSSIILKFLEYDVILKYGNPSNYDRYIFDSFLNRPVFNGFLAVQQAAQAIQSGSLVNPKFFKPYLAGSLPSKGGTTTLIQSKNSYFNEWVALEEYVGFSTIDGLKYSNNGSYITDFFIDNNIEFSVENIKDLYQLIKIYATQKLNKPTFNSTQFNTLLNNYLTDCNKIQTDTLDGILAKIQKDLPNYNEVPEKTIDSKISGQQTKVDLYENVFKALNDKWIAGGDYKNKTFFEDILFLDKASRNIGDTLYLDIFSLKKYLNKEMSMKMSVYTFIANILYENNFVIMNLPAYVNFYNIQNVDGVSTPTGNSLEFADNMWGTFLNVDYREAGPKMVCFFVGRPANYVELPESKNYLFRSDGIQLDKSNPLIEDLNEKQKRKDWAQSNRCVGFTVDIGIRNQNVFSNFSVSQDNGKGTSESVQNLVNMIEQAGGRQSSTQNVGLYNYYSQRSYGCQVVCLGNAMIQPTMYFNLRHVPMFNGPYFITDVEHVITPGQFQTTFKGVRQGVFDLPAIDSFLQSINQNLLTKLEKALVNKTDEKGTSSASSNLTKTSSSVQGASNTGAPTNRNGFVSTAYTQTVINRSDLVAKIKSAIPADSNLQAIIYALCFLRTCEKPEEGFNSFNNNYALISLEKDYSPTFERGAFMKQYSCVETQSLNGKITIPAANFKTVDLFVGFLRDRLEAKTIQISDLIGLHQFYVTEWDYTTVNKTTFETNRLTIYKPIRDKLIQALNVAKTDGITIQNVEKLVDGPNYQEIFPTPTPSPRPIVLPPGQDIFNVRRVTVQGNDNQIIVSIKPNVGLWEIFLTKGQIFSNTPCSSSGDLSEPGRITDDKQQAIFTPLQDALQSCNTDAGVSGIVPLEYDVYANPVLPNGSLDETKDAQGNLIRTQKIFSVNSSITI